MAPAGWQEALQQFQAVVQSLADSCTAAAEAPEGVVTRAAWTGNADRVSGLLPKFTLAFRDRPEKRMCQPLGDLLVQALMDQVALTQLLAAQSCSVVALGVRQDVRTALVSIVDLAAALAAENAAGARTDDQKRVAKGRVTAAFGVATNCCEDLKQCPLDAHRAVAKELHGAARLVKDAMKELQEMQRWEDAGSENGGDEFADDEFGDCGDEQLSDEELAMVIACEKLLRGTGALLEKAAAMLTKTAPSMDAGTELARSPPAPGADGEARGEQWSAEIVGLAKSVQERVDDLVAMLYEFEQESVVAAAATLLEAVDVLIRDTSELPAAACAREAGMDMERVFTVVRRICEEAVRHLQE